MNKKGGVGLPIQNIIGLILGFMSVIVIFALFFALMKMFINPPSAGSTKSLNDFGDIVLAMMDEKNQNTSCYWTVMFIESNWALAGFNADGIRSTTESITCKKGGDCIEERCCKGQICNDVRKPASCGSNPCACLCRTCTVSVGGNCIGTLGGGDCSERGAVCKPIVDTPLKQFFIVDKDYCTKTTGKMVGAVKGVVSWAKGDGYKNENVFSECDLVYDSESCGIGAAKGLQKLASISRTSDRKEIRFEFWSNKDKMKAQFPNIVDCKAMMRDLKKAPQVVYKSTAEDKGTKVTEQLATVKARQ